MPSTVKETRTHQNGKHNAAQTPSENAAVAAANGYAPAEPIERNPGIPLDLDWVYGARINRSAVERRAATLVTRRTVKKEWQAAWLLRAITCIDLTTLSGDDTPGNVRRLCAKARSPSRRTSLKPWASRNLTSQSAQYAYTTI